MGFLSSLFGVSDRTPKTSQIVQANKLPTEIAPYVKDVLGESQALYKADIERGYDPYTGETIAPFTPQEEQAMAGLEGLVGTQKPYLDEALETYRKGGDEFTAETAEKFMSPYQQAVTDIQLREAQENFEGRVMPQFEADAISRGGGPGGLGSRAGIEAAELQRGQSQLLSDIQAQGSQRAYADARAGYEAQKAREQTMATNVGRIGNAMTAAGLQEQGMLQTVGEQKRGMGQSILDEAYGKFLEEKNYPQQTLGVYSDTIYGAAPTFRNMNQNQTTSGLPGAPSMGQQLLGLGMAGANSFNSGTLGKIFGGGKGNVFQQKDGGPVIEAQYGSGRGPIFSRLGKRNQGLLSRIPGETQDVEAIGLTNEQLQIPTMNRFGLSTSLDSPLAKAQMARQVKKSMAQRNRGPVTSGPTATHLKNMAVAGQGGLQSLSSSQIQDNPMSSEEFVTPEGATPPSGKKAVMGSDGQLVWVNDPANVNQNIQAGLRQLAQGIGGGQIFGIDMPDLQADKARLKTEISQDARFNVNLQRQRKSGMIKDSVAQLRKNIETRKKVQKEGYDEEAAELDTFIDEQTTSIQEDGATTSDIMAEAIDQGMNEPTIVTMLTKVLNTNEKGVQKRAREVRKELRELKKHEFVMEKEGRKEKRTDKLANAELGSQKTLWKIAQIANMEKELDSLPGQAKTELANRLAKEVETTGNYIKAYTEIYRTMGVLMAAQRTSGGSGTSGGGNYVAGEKQIQQFVKDRFNWTIKGDEVFIQGKPLDANSPEAKRMDMANKIGVDTYKKILKRLGGTTKDNSNQIFAQDAAEQAVLDYLGQASGGQAGSSGAVRPAGIPSSNNIQLKVLPDGTQIQVDMTTNKAYNLQGNPI